MKSRGLSSGRRITTTPRRLRRRPGASPRAAASRAFSLRTPTTSRSVSLMCTRTSGGRPEFKSPLHQRDVHVLVDVILVAAQPECAVLGVDRRIVDALDRALVLEPVADQIGDRADLQTVCPARNARDPAAAPSCRPRSGSRRSWRPARSRRGAPGRSRPRCGRRASARRRAAPSAEKCAPAGAGPRARASGATAVRMVCARSCAEMPVVTPSAASIDSVKLVRVQAVGVADHQRQAQLRGSARASASGRSGRGRSGP